METVLITGGSGMIGKALTHKLLASGYKVIIFSRSPGQSTLANLSYAKWDTDQNFLDETALTSADYIIHLAGANVAQKRWTVLRKNEIKNSRINGSELLVNCLKKANHHIKKIISASAIGWYGADTTIPNPHPFTEEFLPSTDFLGTTCTQWEQAITPIKDLGIDLVILRTGIVLSNTGGAYKEFLNSLRYGFATVLGSGKQMMSWIHISDLVNLYTEALKQNQYSGVYNAVAPEPINNRKFITTLAKENRGRYHTTIPVPEFILKLILGEMSIEVLKSATVSCSKILEAGFVFEFPTIESAIEHLAKHKAV